MTEHPQIEVCSVPTMRVRNSIGIVTKGNYVSVRHTLNRYLTCWRWYIYHSTGTHPTNDDLDAERGRMLDGLEDALSDMPRHDVVVVS